MSKERWTDPPAVTAVVAIGLSAIALGTSVHSCTTADRSFELVARDSDARRRLFLIAVPEQADRSLALIFKPASPEWTPQRLELSFPPALGVPDDPYVGGALRLSCRKDAPWLRAVLSWLDLHAPMELDKYPGHFRILVPVHIAADYLYLGEPNHIDSAYEITVDAYYRKPLIHDAVQVRGVTLARHESNSVSALEHLNPALTDQPYRWIVDSETF